MLQGNHMNNICDVKRIVHKNIMWLQHILIPRGRTHFGQHQESQPLWWSNFLCMHRVIVLYSQLIRFIRYDSEHMQIDGKSVNHGLLVLDLPRGHDSWCWPKWVWSLRTRITAPIVKTRFLFIKLLSTCSFDFAIGVSSTPDWAVLVRALARNIVYCSWVRHLILTVALSAQGKKKPRSDCPRQLQAVQVSVFFLYDGTHHSIMTSRQSLLAYLFW